MSDEIAPRQSGMEQKHEQWVLAVMNFLQQMQVPFYTYDVQGNRDPMRDKTIPERLKLLGRMIADARRTARDARLKYEEERREAEALGRGVRHARLLLVENNFLGAAIVLDELVKPRWDRRGFGQQ